MPIIGLLFAAFVSEGLAFAGMAKRLHRNGKSLKDWGFGIAAPPSAYMISLLATAILAAWSVYSEPRMANLYFQFPLLKLAAIATACMAGLFEETFFRGYLMTALKDVGRGPVTQIVVSGLAFGLAHSAWGLANPQAWQAFVWPVIATTIGGTVAACIYLYSARRLGPVILGHALYDIIFEPGLIIAALHRQSG